MDVNQLREKAKEQMGFNDVQADAFVDGFVKEAAAGVGFNNVAAGGQAPPAQAGHGRDPWNATTSITHGVVDNFARNIGGGLGNLAMNSLVSGVASLVGSARDSLLHRKFTESLKTVIENNRIVRNADRNKVMSYADTIFRFAPHVASDVNLLTQLLSNSIHGEGVDPTTIETVTRLEERLNKDTSFKPKNLT